MVTPGTPDVEPDVQGDEAVPAGVDTADPTESAAGTETTHRTDTTDVGDTTDAVDTDTTDAADTDTTETTEAAPPSQPPKRRRLLYVTLPGLWGAVIASCISFTPSLLPRTGIVQGIVWGISAAIGYGLGVLVAAIWRAFADRETRPTRHRSWLILAIGGGALIALFFGLGQYWQYLLRGLMGVKEYSIARVVASPFVAILIFTLLITIGRGIRGVYHWLAALLNRWVGERAAHATAWIAAAALTYLVISGVLLNGLVTLMNDAFSVQNGITPPGVHQPTTSLRSGGPGSLVPWDSLGREGRKFIGTGPSAAQIESFTHKPAKEPIRTYAGVESADNTEDRAALAVSDLERTGGFQRKNLLVFTTTGSGWVDPASADTFEYLSDGDSAIVTIQYSYLPSWLSYLVDQTKAREAGRDLFDAVYDKWSKLSPTDRPKLYVGGESLGTYGGESAFSGEYDLSNRTAGALFAGPPNFNTLFRDFSDNRDAGSLESQPIYKKGRIVRFSNDPGKSIPPDGQPWDGTRVLYLMHPSDPIVWWDWSLILHKPDWTSEPPGSDVLKDTVWTPFLTFWQITGDLPFATGVPSGHGHTYKSEYVDGWNTVMRTGLTKDQANTLRDIIAGVNQD